jgi:hypothetical protein
MSKSTDWYSIKRLVTLTPEAGTDGLGRVGTGCPFESNEHVPRPQPFTYKAHSPRWPRIAISTLRSADPYKANAGCICDSGRENIVGHDQGARVSDFPILESTVHLNTDCGIGKWTRILRNVYATLPLSPNRGLLYES